MKFMDDNNICLLSDWPAQSPNLNIIENLWSILKTRVRKRIISNNTDLWEVIKEEFYALDNATIINLYSSIPARLNKVIKAKGYQIKY